MRCVTTPCGTALDVTPSAKAARTTFDLIVFTSFLDLRTQGGSVDFNAADEEPRDTARVDDPIERARIEHEQVGTLTGSQAAAVCDFVYLIGPEQTRDVARGLREAGFPETKLKVCRDLTEATAHMGTMLRPGDAILFENDLPDLYAE